MPAYRDVSSDLADQSHKQSFGRPKYEVIENSYFEETNLFTTTFKNQCRNDPNEPHNIPN